MSFDFGKSIGLNSKDFTRLQATLRSSNGIVIVLLMLLYLLMSSASVYAYNNPARPFGLDIIGPIQPKESDEKSKSGMNGDEVFKYVDYYNKKLWVPELDNVLKEVDPEKIELKTSYESRVYFLGLRGDYDNALGLNTGGYGINEGDPKLVFPGFVSKLNDPKLRREKGQVLEAGEWVNLGNMDAGTKLDFFLISNAGNGGTDVFTANAAYNEDSYEHLIAYAVPDSPYLILGFEDLYGGGDENFYDMVFALEIGAENVQGLSFLTSNPEPSGFAISLIFLFIGYRCVRRETDEIMAVE